MINIKKTILHIIDTNSSITINSSKSMDISDSGLLEYISKHIEKALRDNGANEGTVGFGSLFNKEYQDYKNGIIDFVTFSSDICDSYAQELFKADKQEVTDFLMCEFTGNEKDCIGFLLLPNNTCYTHQVIQEESAICNTLLKFYAVLPGVTQKIQGFAFMNSENKRVRYNEMKRFIDGCDRYIIPDVIMNCEKEISSKEALKVVKDVVNEIAETGGRNSAAVIAKAKVYLSENAEVSETVDTDQLSYAVFPDNVELMEAFKQEIKEKGVPKVINVRQDYALREGKKHKIKTDTGIEITVPAEFFNNRDYIEFRNNIDGTISIAIKNVGKIINK